MVERQHRVGLAAPEVGLQLHHRVAAFSGEALGAAGKQPPETFGKEGAPEELPGVAVLLGALAQMHLPQVRGELRLLVAAAGNIGMRRHHLAPRLEPTVAHRLDKTAGRPAPFAAYLLVEHPAAQLHLHRGDLCRLGRRHRGQQPLGRVEGAVGVVAGEGLLVRPLVAPTAQLGNQAALRSTEGVSEDVVPGLPHQPEKGGGVPLAVRLVDLEAAEHLHVDSAGFDPAVQLAFDERGQSLTEQLHRRADALVVRDCHLLVLLSVGVLRACCCIVEGDNPETRSVASRPVRNCKPLVISKGLSNG